LYSGWVLKLKILYVKSARWAEDMWNKESLLPFSICEFNLI